MIKEMFVVLFVSVCLASARSREVTKVPKPVPGISNSLINLGKMDFNIYLNSRPQDYGNKYKKEPSMTSIKPCPCRVGSEAESTRKHPFDILDKMIRNSNMFSFGETPFAPECCMSGGLVHEDIIVEFPQKPMLRPTKSFPGNVFPFPSDLFMNIPKQKTAIKDKAIEIFLFPKRKDIVGNEKSFTKNIKNEKTEVKETANQKTEVTRTEMKKIDALLPVPQVTNELNDQKTVKIDDSKKEEKKKEEEKHVVKTT